MNKASSALLVTALVLAPATHAADPPGIRLILQITVDGLRADLLNRYQDRFGAGGFRSLLDTGVVYTNAHYQHANTETIVGHTTLATGAYPADHGMTGNVWFHRDTGELGYNIEDPDYPPLPSRAEHVAGAQVDPAQLLARTRGRSPRAILAETFADRLQAYYGGQSRIFSVSGKDRSAVAMAGQVGKAFWISTDSGDFITSSYYYQDYPDWVTGWNARRLVEQRGGTAWELSHELSTYLLGHQDNRPYEADLRGYGRVFPHPFAASGSPLLPTQVLVSPYGDQITLDFARTLVKAEHLGQDDTPDFLSISFSGVDAVNHFFGPSSLENEEMLLRLDATLAQLFGWIADSIGLDRTLIVLSADHGIAEMPEYMAGFGFPAQRLTSEEVVETANRAGSEVFGIQEITRFFFRPYLYLDHNAITAAKLDPDNVQEAIAQALMQHPGIRLAVARSELKGIQTTQPRRQIQRNHHPARSGDIYVAQAPYWFNFDSGPVVAMHGSPWRYDTHVPIIFAGAGIKPGTVARLVHPVDVAPTMAAVVGMTAPASASGEVLVEVIEGR